MEFGDTGFRVSALLYPLLLFALVLILRRILKRRDRVVEKAEPITKEELERRYSEGRLSRDEYLAVRGEILKEEDARALGRKYKS